MFTGIIETLGYVRDIRSLTTGKEMVFECSSLTPQLKSGDSIAVNGVCSTAVNIQNNAFTVQYLAETLHKTTLSRFKIGERVNLELSVTPSSRMGGHFVLGHVDDVGRVENITRDEPWGVLTVSYLEKWRELLVPKGSIAVDGISLTIADLSDFQFTCHIIPFTFKQTRLAILKKGDKVNLEFDILGKYVIQSLARHG